MDHVLTHLTAIDYAVMAMYFVFVLGIGFALRRSTKTSSDFFQSGRSLPPWVTGLAFLSANLGAQEVIGMGASGAKYGIMTSHFYWVGAIPAMVFLAVFMMTVGLNAAQLDQERIITFGPSWLKQLFFPGIPASR